MNIAQRLLPAITENPPTYSEGKHYDFFIDNVILFLEEIDRNKDTYTSIFDSPILARYKAIHDIYGTVFTFCLFYELDFGARMDTPDAPTRELGWNLSRMTDKFKAEFEANSDWFRFNYHAYNYATEHANSARDILADFLATKTEVLRFAGEKSWVGTIHRIHSLSATKEQQAQLRSVGVRVLFFTSMHTRYSGYALTDAQKTEIYTQGQLYAEDVKMLYVTGAGRPEFIILNNVSGVGSAMGLYEYLTRFSNRENPNWYKPLGIDYLSLVGHEYDIWRGTNEEVIAEYLEVARWMQDNEYTPKFFECTYALNAPIRSMAPARSITL